ncbi:MAG: DUF1553 domain-containing protein [Pirellulales bacterium]
MVNHSSKRTIYEKVMRNNLHPIAGLFDFPDRIRSVSKRHRTTTSTQALLLMNNDWIRGRAMKILRSTKDLDSAQFAEQIHQKLLGRSAQSTEIVAALDFIQQYATISPDQADVNLEAAAAELAKADIPKADQSKTELPKAAQNKPSQDKPDLLASTTSASKPVDPTNEPIVGASGKAKPKEETKPESKPDGKSSDKDKKTEPEPVLSAQDQARLAFIHAMLSSNEMIYID